MHAEAEKKISARLEASPDAYPDFFYDAMRFAYADAARMCREYAAKMKNDLGDGSGGHYAALEISIMLEEVAKA